MVITSVPPGTNIDLGVVTASTVKTVAYTIINDGPTSITVSGTVTATGCTASLTPGGGLIPGQSAVITLTLSSFTASGSYTVTFTAT